MSFTPRGYQKNTRPNWKNGAKGVFVKKTPFLKKRRWEMAGRKKEPIDLVIAKGKKHLSKEEIATRKAQEIKVDLFDISPPNYLNEEQIKEFLEIAGKLKHVGIMTELDEDALARYIITKDECIQTDNLLTKELSKKNKIDIDKIYRLQLIQNKLHKLVRTLASDLGLNVSARTKLCVPKEPTDPPENKFSKFVK